MKKQTKRILLIVGVFLVLFFTVGGHFINKYYHEYVKSHSKMYCYHTYYGPANQVLIIENLKYKNALVNYYFVKEQFPDTVIGIGVPLKTLPISDHVHVMGYTKDSLLADVVSYYDRGVRFGGSYTRGWVYAKTLHEKPPKKKGQ